MVSVLPKSIVPVVGHSSEGPIAAEPTLSGKLREVPINPCILINGLQILKLLVLRYSVAQNRVPCKRHLTFSFILHHQSSSTLPYRIDIFGTTRLR